MLSSFLFNIPKLLLAPFSATMRFEIEVVIERVVRALRNIALDNRREVYPSGISDCERVLNGVR